MGFPGARHYEKMYVNDIEDVARYVHLSQHHYYVIKIQLIINLTSLLQSMIITKYPRIRYVK